LVVEVVACRQLNRLTFRAGEPLSSDFVPKALNQVGGFVKYFRSDGVIGIGQVKS